MYAHALDGGSATFNFDLTCAIHTWHEKCAAINQKTDARARPSGVWQFPRTSVPDAAVLPIHITIGRPGVTAFASASPKIAPAISNS